jgi:hypothetical protein
MKKLLIALPIMVLLLAVSCSSGSSTVQMGKDALSGGAVPPTTSVPRLTVPPTTVDKESFQYSGVETLVPDRMIVRTGRMSLVVEDISTAIDRITELAEAGRGYVVSSNSWREGERVRGTITIRVLSGDFGDTMRLIGDMAVEVTSQTTTSQDVTEEYVDLTAKLNNLEATEQQLLRIMEKGEKVEDILAVQRELTNTRQQIEQTKGRMQYLEKTSATSLIEVQLEQSKLEVKLTVNRRFVKSGETVQFTSQVGGGFSPYSYQWDFGDGKTSNEPAPAHAYRGSGNYSITLTVTDDKGNTDTDIMTDYVTVIPGWSAGNAVGSAWNGLVAFGRALLSIGIWLAIFSPVWIVIGAVVFWLIRRRKKA